MSDDFDDFEIDDLVKNKENKKQIKRKNSKKKGNRGELELCKVLTKRFEPREFTRTIGSGNRWSQVKYVKKDFLGDIVCPDGFRFVVECKHGYDIDLHFLMDRKNKQLDDFLKQAGDDSRRSGLPTILCWKKNHYPWIVFIQKTELDQTKSEAQWDLTNFAECCLTAFHYHEWMAISLNQLLKLPDEFFFSS